jgi:DNA polymerase III delta prime subunit
MTYNFKNLSHIDFEDLARDLAGAELGKAFEGFAPGPDGGVDGRHSSGTGNIILQAKHMEGSTFSKLCTTMKREKKKVDKLPCDRYVLVTSRPLTIENKKKLASIIGPKLLSEADIFGGSELQSLLRKHQNIAKAHIKLWLSDSVVLERILNAASHARADFTLDEIESKLKVYVRNKSYDSAFEMLETQHATIIHGPPGVGKTTLAEMLLYAYLADGWELISLRDIEGAFSRIEKAKKQIFYFDDFLGSISLDKNALAKHDSDFVRFFERVKKSPNARFILTTRTYLLEEAEHCSERLSSKSIKWPKHFLNVGDYTRRVRAEILYNHLYHSDLPQAHIENLISAGPVSQIVDHKHYNPRIIEWMTTSFDQALIDEMPYRDAFLKMLSNPSDLWDKAFRKCIPIKCQHLLIALFISGDHGVTIEELKRTYSSIRPKFSVFYSDPRSPDDFQEGLRIIEGSFVSITNAYVYPINPSLRDYLKRYVANEEILSLLAECKLSSTSTATIWRLIDESSLPSETRVFLAKSFLSNAERLLTLPTVRKEQKGPSYSYRFIGMSNGDRIIQLLKWWSITNDKSFSELALQLIKEPADGFNCWRDGKSLVQIFDWLQEDGELRAAPNSEELLASIEQAIRDLLESGLNISDLRTLFEAFEDMGDFDSPIVDQLRNVIQIEFDTAEDAIHQHDDESSLEEDWECYQSLADFVGLPKRRLEEIESAVRSRQDDMQRDDQEYEGPPPIAKKADGDILTDDQRSGMFASLVE